MEKRDWDGKPLHGHYRPVSRSGNIEMYKKTGKIILPKWTGGGDGFRGFRYENHTGEPPEWWLLETQGEAK